MRALPSTDGRLVVARWAHWKGEDEFVEQGRSTKPREMEGKVFSFGLKRSNER